MGLEFRGLKKPDHGIDIPADKKLPGLVIKDW